MASENKLTIKKKQSNIFNPIVNSILIVATIKHVLFLRRTIKKKR